MGSYAVQELLAEADGGPSPTKYRGTLSKVLIDETFEEYAAKTAVISTYQNVDPLAFLTGHQSGPVAWKFGHLKQAAILVASRLKELGHQQKDKLVVVLPNQIEWCLFYTVALILETTFVPLVPNVTTNPNETEHMFRTIGSASIFVKDAALAAKIEQALPTQLQHINIRGLVDAGENLPGWLNIENFLQPSKLHINLVRSDNSSLFDMILFTSGTTSLPKACLQTNASMVSTINGLGDLNRDSDDRMCMPLPGNHVFAVGMLNAMWATGAAIVYPSTAFSAESTLLAMESAQCTYAVLVPTMLFAVLEHPRRPSTDLSALRSVVTGAAMFPASIVKRAMSPTTGLGLREFLNGYGMTEANLILLCGKDMGYNCVEGDTVRTGQVCPGAKVRICKPGTKELVRRGERGELHNGGERIIHGYLNADSTSIYPDETVPGSWWIASGDQAMMDHNGIVTVFGRYKDIIIRGGENISPASIEAVLDSVDKVKSQVVGYPDEIAGEVPIYVIWTEDGSPAPRDRLLNVVLERMGSRYSPRAILHIKHDLGYDLWPCTASGKARKAEIAGMVRKHLDKSVGPDEAQTDDTLQIVAQMWASVSGNMPELLIQQNSRTDVFADSIMVMQFISMIRKRLHKDITIADLAAYPTIVEQARLIDSRASTLHPSDLKASESEFRPPQASEMVFCKSQKSVELSIQTVKNVLQPFGLDWEHHVDAVLPTYDYGRLLMRRLRPQSWNNRFICATSQANVNELRKAIEAMLANQPMLRAIGVHLPAEGEEDDAHHQASQGGDLLHGGPLVYVIPRPVERYFDLVIRQGVQVEKPQDIADLPLDDPIFDYGSYPGPLVRISLVEIKSTGTAAFILNGQHSTYDATSSSWLDDLTQILQQGSTKIPAHADYKQFADLYHIHRHGPSAQKSAQYFADRLQGIDEFLKHNEIWPKQIAPEWFKGPFTNWYHSDSERQGHPGHNDERQVLDKQEDLVGAKGISQRAHIPGLVKLKQQHNIPASMVLKSACAIFNIRQQQKHNKQNPNYTTTTNTKENQPQAIFANHVASRTWPFWEDYTPGQKTNLPAQGQEATAHLMDMPGPCYESLINRISVASPSETALEFMHKVTTLQQQDTPHSHAPLSLIQKLSSLDDAKCLNDLLRRQIFNWLPLILSDSDDDDDDDDDKKTSERDSVTGTKTKTKQNKDNAPPSPPPPLHMISHTATCDTGVLWNAGLLDPSTVKVSVSWDDAQFSQAEMRRNLREFVDIAVWLGDEGNWDRKVEQN